MESCGTKKESRLILCEGNHDLAFFKALLSERNIIDYCIVCPDRQLEPGGFSGYRRCLQSLAVGSDYPNVNKILIVGDNDSNPKKQFASIQNEIRESGKRYGIPAKTQSLKKSQDGLPAVGILMLPSSGIQGCLETLLLPAIYASSKKTHPNLKPAADAFCSSTSIDSWDTSKSCKAQLRIMLTSMYEKNPYLSLAYVWKKPSTAKMIPLNGKFLNKLVSFLRKF